MTDESLQRKQDTLVEKEPNVFDEIRAVVSENQFKVLEKLFEIETIPNTKTELAEMLGISRVSWYTWLKDTSFRSALYAVGRIKFAADDPFINQILADKAKAGEIGAIRLMKELTGQFVPNQKNQGPQVNVQINFDKCE